MRLHVIAEGQTEETFVNDVLAFHLAGHEIATDVRCVQTSRSRSRVHRGGVVNYHKVQFDVTQWLKQEYNAECRFTTMLDFYALPTDFPGYADTKNVIDPYQKVDIVENAFREDISDPRFIPYIQLHEFEALLFSDIQHMDWAFIDHKRAIDALVQMSEIEPNPELINDHPNTAPSKRIIKHIPEYSGRKSSAGPLVATKIGLPTLRAKCRHFDEWLTRLEALGS